MSESTDVISSILEGLGLEKYNQLFKEKAIDMKVFLSLMEDDLRYIGITDEEDIAKLAKSIIKFRIKDRTEHRPVAVNKFRDEEINAILTNTVKHLRVINTAVSYTVERIQKDGNMVDMLTSDNISISDNFQQYYNLFRDESDKLIKELEITSPKMLESNLAFSSKKSKTLKNTVFVFLGTTVALSAIYSIYLITLKK